MAAALGRPWLAAVLADPLSMGVREARTEGGAALCSGAVEVAIAVNSVDEGDRSNEASVTAG